VKVLADDLFGTPLEQAEIEFENEGGETYICGNPPYLGVDGKQTSRRPTYKPSLPNAPKTGNLSTM
jgi:hypothetical protein